ncbi:MAG: uracil-DNA glycosylase [Gaiellaceae bacterium]
MRFLRWYYPDQVCESAAHSSRPLSPVAPSSPYASPIVAPRAFVAELASARIGATFNQYAESSRAPLLRERLARYLAENAGADVLLVGEAPGYRGARVSGIPFTSERQLTGRGPAEATATIVHGVLAELDLEERVLLWNVVPTHPGSVSANRPPTRAEIVAGLPFVGRLAVGRRVIAVGRLAHGALGGLQVRHPSRGGAVEFRAGLVELLDRGHLVSGTA